MAEDMKDLGKYDPSQIEQKWYDFWEKHGVFHDEPDSEKEPYSIMHNENLPVSAVTCANADNRNGELRGNSGRKITWYTFKNEH